MEERQCEHCGLYPPSRPCEREWKGFRESIFLPQSHAANIRGIPVLPSSGCSYVFILHLHVRSFDMPASLPREVTSQ